MNRCQLVQQEVLFYPRCQAVNDTRNNDGHTDARIAIPRVDPFSSTGSLGYMLWGVLLLWNPMPLYNCIYSIQSHLQLVSILLHVETVADTERNSLRLLFVRTSSDWSAAFVNDTFAVAIGLLLFLPTLL